MNANCVRLMYYKRHICVWRERERERERERVTLGVTLKSYTFFKPLDLNRFNGQKISSLMLIF